MRPDEENTQPIPVIPERDPRPGLSRTATVVLTTSLLILTTGLLALAVRPTGLPEVAALFAVVIALFFALLFLSFAVGYVLYKMWRLVLWMIRRTRSRGRHRR